MIDIQQSSFNPLVFITSDGIAPECTRANKRLAEKCREPSASVKTYIGTKLTFTLLRTFRVSQTLTSVYHIFWTIRRSIKN